MAGKIDENFGAAFENVKGVEGENGQKLSPECRKDDEPTLENINSILYKSFDGYITVSNIPEEIKIRNDWVDWYSEYVGWETEEDRNRKPRKLPLNPLNGEDADVTDSLTWGCLEDALKRIENNPTRGLGFVFSSGNPYTGIDLDECRNPSTGIIEPWALEIISSINSYTEISPSGCGVHIMRASV